MIIGYIRTYHEDLSAEEQQKILTNIECDVIIKETDSSSNDSRVELENIMKNLQQGDTIVVTKLLVLADSMRHLVELLEVIEVKGAIFQSLTEGIDTKIDSSYSFINIAKHLLEFQSDLISQNTKKGLNKAKQQGVHTGRPKKSESEVVRAIAMYRSNEYSLAEIKKETGISKSTLYRYLES
ncbi:Site-specific DNA recombinase [Mesobacillus persicus]|uniref:Site-specific DNA recombinase n=1 Tax=Mesobacillus persicus TaxID=930146 RepID=A0A1H8JIB4_9BACI|nr:recombinase family protein [Mesobacillus persicus]SEN80480.1 Site-specific DNA recombinase [Mesobacillus persicus]